ncbi:MAG: polyribonucleotide nucleotidyltransferase [Candidatus Wallbacteria bacterium]|nr:polyribonucleotide nucleotidyltransferase [Candidatus Wallbacteria bacterium]
MPIESVELEIGGKKLVIETGRVAKQADGACVLRYGDTVLLATVCAMEKPGFSDFFPLTIEFRERDYATGKIPGGFFKREGRPADEAVLAARMIDRPIRPLFPDDYREEVQVIVSPLAMDKENSPQALGIVASSTALAISDIPFENPVGAVRMGKIGDRFIVNISDSELVQSEIDLIVAGTKDAICMVEAGAKEASEATMLEAIRIAHEEIRKIIAIQDELKKKCGKPVKKYKKVPTDKALSDEIAKANRSRIREAVKIFDKKQRSQALAVIDQEITASYESKYQEQERAEKIYVIKNTVEEVIKQEVRSLIVLENFRADGRKTTEIRPIECLISVLPRVHGSSLFTRGQTQSLGIVTLGTAKDAQMIDSMGQDSYKRFMLHYNFPPFSVGEVKQLRGPGRREIGHGALAERAILPLIPSDEEFPYTTRVVSEILESNGSSSMATVCSTSLALMEAGVPIKKAVAGVAMGLVKEGEKFTVLTDIQGLEDHYGDMDFKVAGTKDGITALQMDIKIKGLSFEIMQQALVQAKDARLFILGKMNQCIAEPKKELSPHAPRITAFFIDIEKIKDVIGPGGKMIKKIIADTGVEIDIEDDGSVRIYSVSAEGSDKAKKMIDDITADVEIGKIYDGRVTRLMNFGAFVEILPGKEGLVHISKLAKERVNKVEDVVNVGDMIQVKVIEIDSQNRVNLSRKDCL